MLTSISRFAASSVRYSFDLVLPPVCVSCAALVIRHNLVCAQCWREMHLITPPLCERLGTPLLAVSGNRPHISAAAMTNRPQYERARAAAHYGGVIRRLITRFKFEDRHEPLPLFIKLMRDAGRDLLADADILMPVPLHRLRLLQRRFNQSALLAKGLSKTAQIPVAVMALKRVRRTVPQLGLTHSERAANVAQAFKITRSGQKLIAGRNVLLIDDVITTGATVNACAEVLKTAGAKRVDVLAVAMVCPSLPNTMFAADGP